MSKIKLLLIFYSLQFSVLLKAQVDSYHFKYLTVKNGLSQNSVIEIEQDKLGFIWIGTKDGLNQFDGYSFNKYYHDFLDSNSLSANEITSIHCDNSNNLWIGTRSGINLYRRVTDNFQRIIFDPNDTNSLSSNFIQDLETDEEGNVYAASDKGLNILHRQSMKIERVYLYNLESQLHQDQTITKIIRGGNNFFFGTRAGVAQFSQRDQKLQLIQDNKNNIGEVYALSNYDSEHLIIGAATGFYLLDKYSLEIKRVKILDQILEKYAVNLIKDILKDRKGNFWIAKWDGIFIFNPVSKNIQHLEKTGIEGSLNSNSINKLFQDSNETMWVGTTFGGLHYYDPNMIHFKNLNENNGLPTNVISGLTECDNNNLWIGTIGNGISIFNKSLAHIKNFSSKNSKLKSDLIRVLFGHGKNIWIGTWNNYFQMLNTETGNFHTFDLNEIVYPNVPYNSVRTFCSDMNGNIWVGTSKTGIIKIDSQLNAKQIPLPQITLNKFNVNKILKDNNEKIWAITNAGIFILDEKNDMLNKLDISHDNPINKIKMITGYFSSDNFLWIGTYGNGLIKFNTSNNEYKIFNLENGLQNNVVYGIVEDDDNLIWISTNSGLARINTETNVVASFSSDDGLQSDEFNDNAYLKTQTGNILFGGINGVTVFNPSTYNVDANNTPVRITEIKFLHKNGNQTPYLARIINRTLELDYFENNFTVNFAALNYSLTDKVFYAFKLEPLNKEWISNGKSNTLTFSNLAPGAYTLKIIGSDNLLSWDFRETELPIQISPPFWLTWWFKLLGLIILIGIIAGIIYLKFRNLLEIERLRTKIASDLHDEVGSSLAKISINSNMLVYEKDEKRISERIGRLSELSNEVVSSMNDVVWSIDARNDKIIDLIDFMKNFAATYAAEKNIEINFITENKKPNLKVPLKFRQNIYLIFKEAVNNAVKYSESQMFDIEISFSGNEFYFKIADNGIGIQKKKRKGNGIRNMRMRAESLKAHIEFIEENGLTIKFRVKIK